ncbi:MAG TPA: Ig-like domain-containing protein [Gammaproteobacteria bacterium]|nr:Ig-like domain-containing protein [Gammaproteobacteria bacterium]
MNTLYSRFLLAGTAALVVAFAGCGGYSSDGKDYTPPSNQPVSLSITPTDATIAVGETQQFKATAKNSSGGTVSAGSVSWHSSDQGVATINSDGLLTAVAEGTTKVTATRTVSTGGGPYGGNQTSQTLTSNEATVTVTAAEQMTGTAVAPERGTQMLVMVHDASGNTQTTMADASGHFALSVAGMRAPFLVQARDSMGRQVYSIGLEPGVVNVNQATDFLARTWFRTNGLNADTAFTQGQALTGLDRKTLTAMDRSLTKVFRDSLVRDGLTPEHFSFFNTPYADNSGTARLIQSLQATVTPTALTIREGATGRRAEAVIGSKQTATLRVQVADARPATEVRLLPAD